MKYLINISGNIPHAKIDSINIPLNGRNLIITGANGSGKTSFLNKLHESLNTILDSLNDQEMKYKNNIQNWKNEINRLGASNPQSQAYKNLINEYQDKLDLLQLGFKIQTIDFEKLKLKYQNYKAVFQKFDAMRDINIEESMQTTSLNSEIEIAKNSFRQNIGNRLEQHLLNLKTSEAFAKGIEKNENKGKKFENWFSDFEVSLKKLFENDETKLIFKHENRKFEIYNGKINTNFQNLSSGYKAIFDIFADLLLRTEFFDITPSDLEGVVLIDEIDAHLHISLQKKILPFFTGLFPLIQFIVSTHSPFVITSTDNDTVVYDISSGDFFEEDLSRYSYESVIKGLFHVETKSDQLASEVKAIAEILNNKPNNHEELREILRNITPFAKQLDVESKSFYFKALNHLLDNQELGDLDV